MPGAVCQDPRFIGGDGITFYFHGKKDKDFCLVTQPNLHINAHFIGKRNQKMNREFTWVQSIAILFGDHRLYVGAQKTTTWNEAVDRLSVAFDGEPISLSPAEGATWRLATLPSAAVKRDEDDCFAHLELGFKFYSLSGSVDGILGQTYRANYVSRAKLGVPVAVLGGEREFSVSNLFAADCSASQFRRGNLRVSEVGLELPSMKCGSGIDGRGVVCKR
ncbi:hypothetical protein CDL12_18683 [Handroanthus impetiginosus]|uniref:Uncharacterized protein n=1 Tax=Handroanthus impetiginosus TaxID=429701 RepID=A0A2G9GTX7_9LAMI|nr:hypothetical protein CDL12_18683 [Handroanthus impetiginosus]